ncbi:MAG: LEPR-XLL domain-containing protein, partial [Burkholderiales bacterium]
MWWPRKRRPRADRALAEPLEPRILYAADLAAAAMLTDITPAESAVHARPIDAEGDYAATPASTASAAPPAVEAPAPAAVRSTLPLNFEVNAGQVDASIDFIARGSGVGIALADGNATLVLRDGERTDVVTMTLADARDDAVAHAEGEVTSRSNYLIGSADRWLLGVANHAAVRYEGVYEGIDLRYYGNERALEYDFLVAPG